MSDFNDAIGYFSDSMAWQRSCQAAQKELAASRAEVEWLAGELEKWKREAAAEKQYRKDACRWHMSIEQIRQAHDDENKPLISALTELCDAVDIIHGHCYRADVILHKVNEAKQKAAKCREAMGK